MTSDVIPTFNELFFRGSADALAQLFTNLQNYLPPSWYHDVVSEQNAAAMGIDGGYYRCYGFNGASELPQALLWVLVEDRSAQVVNIIAPQLFELKYLSYNRILESFTEAVKQPAVTAGVEVSYATEKTLEEVLKPEPARLFKRFAQPVNPNFDTLYSEHSERWQDFLISAHKHQIRPDAVLLGRWLKVECQWQEQAIDRTLDELQTGLDLLDRYEKTLTNPPYADAA